MVHPTQQKNQTITPIDISNKYVGNYVLYWEINGCIIPYHIIDIPPQYQFD